MDDTPRAMGKWEVTKIYIQEALIITKRLQEFFAEWEEREQVFSGARGSLIKHFQQRYSYVVEQLENLESFVIAEDVPVLANDYLPSEKFSVASKVVIGVTVYLGSNWRGYLRSQRTSSWGCGYERKVRKLE